MPGQNIKDRARQAEIASLRRKGLDENGNPLASTDTEFYDDQEEQEQIDDTSYDQDAEDDATFEDHTENSEDQDPTLEKEETASAEAELREKLAKAEHQIKSLMGRVPMAQQQLEQERSTNTALQEKLREMEARMEEIQARENQVSVEEAIRGSLTEEDLDIIGVDGANVISKAVQAAAKALMPKINPRDQVEAILKERDTQTVDQFRRQAVREDKWLSKLGDLAHDSAFNDWLQENPEVDSALRDLSTTQDKNRITRLVRNISRRIGEYHGEDQTKESKPEPKVAPKKTSVPNPAVNRARHMRRAPKEQLTAQEAKARLEEAKRLARSGRAADRKRAEELINSI